MAGNNKDTLIWREIDIVLIDAATWRGGDGRWPLLLLLLVALLQ
jgi:hypothetical protein